ncbi:MAG: hypothetical protein BZY80_06900 [SAR202 cluster bacterium Io17-Chloro-G2]|nr:MAG: hypothetical protein BZY80_06900 [SAR202 cluster bacterium Io17-Chloro-G2]
METGYTREDLEQMVKDSDEKEFYSRVARLGMLCRQQDDDPGFFNSLALAYHEEARLCWVNGAYVAAILMSQLALEEMIRSHYRAFSGNVSVAQKVDRAGFADLIDQAEKDGWVETEEAKQLHVIRKNYRNPYVHPHDNLGEANSDAQISNPNAFTQAVKIYAPQLGHGDVMDEAWQVVKILVVLFPRISYRFWPVS